MTTVAQAMKLGKHATGTVNARFAKPMSIEFEKVYFPFLLLIKKRYAGMWYQKNPEVPDKMDVKGLESVRRDSCGLTKEVVEKSLNLVLAKRDPEAAKVNPLSPPPPFLYLCHRRMSAGAWATWWPGASICPCWLPARP